MRGNEFITPKWKAVLDIRSRVAPPAQVALGSIAIIFDEAGDV